MEPNAEKTALLNLDLAMTATPAITFLQAPGIEKPVEGLQDAAGFSIALEATIPLEALTAVLNTYLRGKRFELSEGFIKQHVMIEACNLYNDGNSLMVSAPFSGSFKGTLYFRGVPFYNDTTQAIMLQPFDYDLKTKNFLLKGAKWLFDKIIVEEIAKYTVLPLTTHYEKAKAQINEILNKQWANGIQGAGAAQTIEITSIQVQEQQLRIRGRCSGRLHITLDTAILAF